MLRALQALENGLVSLVMAEHPALLHQVPGTRKLILGLSLNYFPWRGTIGVFQPFMSSGFVPDFLRPLPLPHVALNGPTKLTSESALICFSSPTAHKQPLINNLL